MTTLKYLLATSLACGAICARAASAQAAQEPAPGAPRIVRVAGETEFRRAVAQARPGTRIEVAPGQYAGAFFSRVRGEKGKRITIAGRDPKNPPVFKWLQFSDPAFLLLQDIAIRDAPANGLNIDDGGDFDSSAQNITLRRVRVSDAAGTGNVDGIKLSGLRDFVVEQCTLERWGDGGSGIDMVGCREGKISRSTFRHNEGQGDNGVQAKGGSRDIAIEGNRFENAGRRSINAGGSTDEAVFRPPLKRWFAGEPFFEAKNLRIEHNTFIGSDAPLSFVGVDGAVARHNTIYKPRRWAMRILQETVEPGFAPCRNVLFERNLIVWESARWIEGGVNIGPGTRPESFRFKGNWWKCEDKPTSSRPTLPTPEAGGTYGRDPMFEDAQAGKLWLKKASPARRVGAQVLAAASGA